MLEDIKFNGDIHRILVPLLSTEAIPYSRRSRPSAKKIWKTKYGFSRIIAVTIDSFLLYFTNGFTSTASIH